LKAVKRKTKKLLDEASYYTGNYSGQQAPETISAYEYSRDSVPTLNKIGNLKDQGNSYLAPQELPFPFQDAVKELADLYLKAQDLRNKARNAEKLPFFKGREKPLIEFRGKLNGIMVECKKLATKLQYFSLAPR
jgi:hypothetical protein